MLSFLKNKTFLWILVLFAAGFFLLFYFSSEINPAGEVKRFESVLHDKERQAALLMDFLKIKLSLKSPDEIFKQDLPVLKALYEREGVTAFVFFDDTLKFWTDNSIPDDFYDSLSGGSGKFQGEASGREIPPVIRLKNGWYRFLASEYTGNGNQPIRIISCFRIKSDYRFQNKYLQNKFEDDFGMSSDCSILAGEKPGAYPVHSASGTFLFSLQFGKEKFTGNTPSSYLFILTILILIMAVLFLAAIRRELKTPDENSSSFKRGYMGFWLAFFTVTVLLLRFLMIYNRFPGMIYDLPAFSPKYYAASALFPSLGDFMVNAMTIFYIVFFLHLRLRVRFDGRGIKGRLIFFVLAVMLLSACAGINFLLTGLVLNSNIPLKIYNLFDINFLTVMAVFSLGLLFASLFYFMDKTISIMADAGLKRAEFLLLLGLSFCGYCWILISNHISGPVFLLWPVFPVALIFFTREKHRNYSFASLVVFAVLISLVALYSFFTLSNERDLQYRKVLAEKLVQERDPVAEYIFSGMYGRLKSDTALDGMVCDSLGDRNKISAYLNRNYFTGFWSKYELQVTLCKPQDTLVINPGSVRYRCFDFFEKMILEQGKATIHPDFYFLQSETGRISYLARLSFPDNRILFMELNSKINYYLLGYPELLLNRPVNDLPELPFYSYAKYKDDKLISHTESFPYRLTSGSFSDIRHRRAAEKPGNGFYSVTRDMGFVHLAYKPDSHTLIVVSKKSESPFEYFVAFTYLFTFFMLFLIFLLFFTGNFSQSNPGGIAGWWTQVKAGVFKTFRTRIQFSIIGVLVLSLLPVGILAYYYITKLHVQEVDDLVRGKSQSILIELEDDFSDIDSLTPGISGYLSAKLVKLSNIFFTDINVYLKNGDLAATSRDEIFAAGLTGTKINPYAYSQLMFNGSSQFLHNENIGLLSYVSAYIPFYNYKREVIAFLNVPYFARQGEVRKEISTFIATLLNVYVLLILLSLAAALVISNWITLPLRLLREKLSGVTLGQRNEPIYWKGADELGRLITQYNAMIAQLEDNAQKLAKSERESAWREMARQVAHEIKNPLTPMRLHIQQLERTIKNLSPTDAENFNRVTGTLLEQIDSLSSIAGAFSDFAKMPALRKDNVNLTAIISDAALLFRNTGNANINLLFSGEERNIYSDREQLLRAFNNIIKNSIQAIPEGKKGVIDLNISEGGGCYTVSVKDNGTGIPEGQRDKIFVPNFTTKSGGMGLGLAIVRSIVEQSGGKIWFEPAAGEEGTKFFIELPKSFQKA